MITYRDSSALIVVDMQNDFADADGSLYVSGGSDLIGPINREIVRATAAGGFVVYTQDWHPPTTAHFEKDGGIWPVHCVEDTFGAEFHPRLLIAGPTIRKGVNGEDGYSGFTMRDPSTGDESPTPLAGLLRRHTITSTIVVGLALDYCVGATALDSVAAGFETSVSGAHTAAVDLQPGDGDRMIADLGSGGVNLI